MKKLFLKTVIYCICISTPFSTLAAPNASDLFKVTSDLKQKCIEYYNYKGSLYCSTKQLNTQSVDPNIKNEEMQVITFDDRPWQPVWSQKNDRSTTIEYVPMGEDINNWYELVTSQFYPGLQNKISAEKFSELQIKNLKDSGFKPIITIIKNSNNIYIFEFQIASPPEQAQDEIQKITVGKEGMYVLHYVIKKNDMGKERRNRWVSNLSNSTLE